MTLYEEVGQVLIYHGSSKMVEVPIWGCGKKYNDYGQGFYCTAELEMAKEWAASKDRNGYANCYELEFEELKVLDLREEQYCVLHWLAILLNNRTFDMPSLLALEAKEYLLEHFLVDVSQYDVVIGYRADDSYYSFAQDFVNGTISYRQLGDAMSLGKLGYQIVLISEKAFQALSYSGVELVESKDWFEKKYMRDQLARRDYFDMRKSGRQKGDLYIIQIIDEEMESDDQRLR